MLPKDFIKFCSNIKFYISHDLVLIEQKQYSFPVVLINDITLYCVHYNTFEEVVDCWQRRKERIQWNNMYLIMAERDGCSYEELLEFDKLPYKNKVVFVHKPMPEIKSAVYIKDIEMKEKNGHKVKVLTDWKGKYSTKRYIDDFDYVNFLNKK